MKIPANGGGAFYATTLNNGEGVEKKNINQELWQACAGPLVNLPAAGTHVLYFPQGHSEQVAASMKKGVDSQVPSYPNLPSKLLCLLHNVTLHADLETDEVYAQMTLQPVPSYDKDALMRSDLALKSNRPQTEFFCKTLTASDTSTHGGFSVPRRAAEKIFPPLDFSMQPPAQELVARDLHGNAWTFRHIFRGQPKRHLLTTGWSLFVSGKRLFAGDSVLFIRDEKQQLLLGIRRANRQPTNLSSSVLSSDSMHIGVLAAAAHAAANNSAFTVFYNPRTSPSEFVIPLAKYYKAIYGSQLSLGMRFRMMFETEDSGTRRYMGTITGINDLDPVRWKNSQWRNLQVGWDESTAGDRRSRVSVWEIEPVTAPFFICPPPFFGSKRPRQLGMSDDDPSDIDNLFKKTMPWLGDGALMKDPHALPGLSLVQWMNMQQNPSLAGGDLSRQLAAQPSNLQFNVPGLPQQAQQLDQLPKLQSTLNPFGTILQSQHQLGEQSRQIVMNQNLPTSQVQAHILHSQANNVLQQQPSSQTHQLQINLPQNLLQQHHTQHMGQNQQQSFVQPQLLDQANQQLHMSDNQIQRQLLQKLQQQQQSFLAQQSALQQPGQFTQPQDQQRQQLDVSHGFATSITTSQMLDIHRSTSLPPQSSALLPQMTRSNSQTNTQFCNVPQLPKPGQQQISSHMEPATTLTSNHMSTAGNMLVGAAVGGQSIVTNDVTTSSTSRSPNNCSSAVHPVINSQAHRNIAQSAAMVLNPLETISSSVNLSEDLHKSDVKPSVNISKNQNQGFFAPQTAYLNGGVALTDHLDTSSSTASVCLSQNDVPLPQHNSSLPYHPQSMLLSQDAEVQVDPRNHNAYGSNIDDGFMDPESLLTKGMVELDKEYPNHFSSGGMLTNYENSKEAQQDVSSSMVSQAFGVPDMTFDATINDGSFMNKWASQPQLPRMRTYTKVYKRGAVGRSIDITRYSGYDELKQDLARRFGIEGQLEDRQRIGWKLVYVDHENDVLLVGDDPWEEFVSCVRCIKILSPQEVEQMSLDGDFGNLPNQACSSSA